MLCLLEENSDVLRGIFFQIRADFLSRLSQTFYSFQNTSKVERELFWMSRLVESCIVKSECFLDLLRLLALDHALETTNVKGIMYVGAQTSVAESLLQLLQQF